MGTTLVERRCVGCHATRNNEEGRPTIFRQFSGGLTSHFSVTGLTGNDNGSRRTWRDDDEEDEVFHNVFGSTTVTLFPPSNG